MKTHHYDCIAAVFFIVSLVTLGSSGEPPLTALDTWRFGPSSELSVSTGTSSRHDLDGIVSVTVPHHALQLTILGSGIANRNTWYQNPTRLFLTRFVGRDILSCGIGYCFNEQKNSASSLIMTCKGPDIAPYTCIDSTLEQLTAVTWVQRHSLLLSMNGLRFIQPAIAFVGGIEMVYTPVLGFMFTENNTAGLITIRDFDHDAHEYEVSLTAGIWRFTSFWRRHWSQVLKYSGTVIRFSSLPLFSNAITAYALNNDPDYPTLQYTGESYISQHTEFDYTLSDENPDQLFFSFNRGPLLSLPLLAIDTVRWYTEYHSSSRTRVAINRWSGDHGNTEYARTAHQYHDSQWSWGGNCSFRCYFLRNFYIRADGDMHTLYSKNQLLFSSSGRAGVGVRYVVTNSFIADLGSLVSRSPEGITSYAVLFTMRYCPPRMIVVNYRE